MLDIKLQQNFKAVHLLQQCCLSNISTIMNNNRHIIDTLNTYKDLYKYFRHQPATEPQCCSLAATVLFVKYINNNE